MHEHSGKAINVTSKVTAALSFGMDGFDMLAMGVSLFDPSNALVEFNRKLHSNAFYNGFQIAVNALAVSLPGGIDNEVLCCRYADINTAIWNPL